MPTLDMNSETFHYHIDDFSDPWNPGAPALLHHAAGGNLHRWRPWVPTLARKRPVVRFDMRGHSGTPPPSGMRFILPDLAADIARVMDALNIERVHLVGASAGGIVSLRFAHDFPDRLHSLTLVASTPKLARMGASVNAGGLFRSRNGGMTWSGKAHAPGCCLTQTSGLVQIPTEELSNGTPTRGRRRPHPP